MIQEKQEQYGNDMVHVVLRSKLFFLEYIFIPVFLITIFVLALWYIVYEYLNVDMYIIIIGMSIMFILSILYYSVIKRFIDYHMDYCIITPDEIILAEQQGLFKRQIRSLDAIKIKSISTKKRSIINSIFNNGSIIFMSDGDETLGEIILEYVHNPEKQKDILSEIIKK